MKHLLLKIWRRVFQNVAHATIEYGLKMYIRIGYLPFARVSLKLKSDLIFSNYSKLAGLLFEVPPFLCQKTRKDVTK